MTRPARDHYAGYRFPAAIISRAVWLYFRFPLGLRMVEELLAARSSVTRIPLTTAEQVDGAPRDNHGQRLIAAPRQSNIRSPLARQTRRGDHANAARRIPIARYRMVPRRLMNMNDTDHGSTSKPRVFISYSRADIAFAENLLAALGACGFDTYLDTTSPRASSGNSVWDASYLRLIL